MDGVGVTESEYSTLVQRLLAVIAMSSAVPVIKFLLLLFTPDMSRTIAEVEKLVHGSL